MKGWADLFSPGVIAGVVLWIGLLIAATWWAIPIFANVATPGLNCTPVPCPTDVTTEWVPSLTFGAGVATIAVGVIAAAAAVIRRLR